MDFGEFNVDCSNDSLRQHFHNSALAIRAGIVDLFDHLTVNGEFLSIPKQAANSYLASILADFIRQQLVKRRLSFTFETVMSSADKVDLLAKARIEGFRTYLYYIATDDPAINVWRVKRRVELGGHNVPTDKIISRYHRSLALLLEAIRNSDRAYLFDNSGIEQYSIAEITSGRVLQMRSDTLPNWFKQAIWDKLQQV